MRAHLAYSKELPTSKTQAAALLMATLIALAMLTCAVVAPAYAMTAAEAAAGKAEATAEKAEQRRTVADEIEGRIDSLQTSLNSMKALQGKATAEHDDAIAQRDEAAARIEAATARLETLKAQMSSFAVSMYKDHGASTFLAVLLQTTSMQDFLTSWNRCEIISEKGKSLIEEEKVARAEIESAKETYEQQAKRAEQQMKVATAALEQVEKTQRELSAEVNRLNDEADELEEEAEELEEEARKAAERAKADEKESKQKKKQAEQKQEVSDEDAEEAEAEREAKEAELAARAANAAAAARAAEAIAAAAEADPDTMPVIDDGFFANPCPTATESSGFGYRTFDHSFHKGLDMAAAQGTPYYAAEAGTVLYATNDGGYNGGAGNWVVIVHGNGIVTKYMHSLTTFVKPGEQVERGQNIGLVGNTGNSFGAHLHFQVEIDGVAVNPLNYIEMDD